MPRGAAQHKGSDRAADFREREVEDIEGDADGDRRIDPSHVVQDNEGTARDHRNRSQGIRKIGQEQGPDVYTVLLHRPREQCRQRIHHKRDTAEDEHRPATDLGRGDDPHAAFIDQIEPHKDQGGIVGQRRDDLDPAVAECHALVRRATRNLAGGESDRQRSHVREVVQRVGDQGKAAGQDAPGDLCDREKRIGPDRCGYPTDAGGRADVRVIMIMGHWRYFWWPCQCFAPGASFPACIWCASAVRRRSGRQLCAGRGVCKVIPSS